jgi:hypothetical protein
MKASAGFPTAAVANGEIAAELTGATDQSRSEILFVRPAVIALETILAEAVVRDRARPAIRQAAKLDRRHRLRSVYIIAEGAHFIADQARATGADVAVADRLVGAAGSAVSRAGRHSTTQGGF